MPYLVATDTPTQPAGERFRALVERGGILQIPGAHNGIAALQARAAGFEALYLSGAAMTASMGLPDLGVITVDEVCFFVRQVARASGLPVLARIIHEKCAIKVKPLISLTTMRMGCLMKFFAMKSLAQVFGGLGRFRAVR